MTREEAIKRLYELQFYCASEADSCENGCGMWQNDVDALDMAIAALREQPRWISVEERLPEKNAHCLVYEVWAYGGMVSMAFYTPKYNGFEPDLKGKAIWYRYDSEYGDFEVSGVTHWMPLPEAPEVEV